ncbi:MAG: hypothetical protein LLG00_05965 [Planctomycetaceae bacterium]|nr:hypothetical protein [Planctomycetaceae bacterium]
MDAIRCLAFSTLLLVPAVAAVAARPAPPTETEQLRAEVSRLLVDLNNDRFEVRSRAARRLDDLIGRPKLGPLLATEFERRLVRTDLSFEVRRRLMRWLPRLPAPDLPPGDASPKELDELVRQTDDDSCAVRLGAAERLGWLLGNPKLVCPVMTRLKRRLADSELSPEAHRQLVLVWQRARGAWLASDPAGWDLPAVSQRQMDQWLDDLVLPISSRDNGVSRRRSDAAQRELLDLLARDQYVPLLSKAIQARLNAAPTPNAVARLNELLEWTKPELIAEYWSSLDRFGQLVGMHQEGEQHLIVGVPTLSPGALKPTHFDRADDRIAHYVTGNSLTPGDYPVGEAFPHPQTEQGFFHLVNLPTPRRRMAYLYPTRGADAKRLAELSRRTLDHVLADKRPLSEPELAMLDKLDPAEVSRFAGRYFLLVDDVPLTALGPLRAGGRPSRFGMICADLAKDGTKDAIPGLLDAIANDRFLPPTSRGPYRLHWAAALSIAARDSWPTTDAWLADQVGRKELLAESLPSAALLREHGWEDDAGRQLVTPARVSPIEVAATAAALLLTRHGRSPSDFDLQLVPDELMGQLHVDGYRFADEKAREKVRQWWGGQKAKPAEPSH